MGLTQRLSCFLYDAFTSHRFGGNVAGVVLLERPTETALLQALAAELGAPTTGFVQALGVGRYRTRFFSSTTEMAMCGHVTIAVACALVESGRLEGAGAVQETLAGEVPLALTHQDGQVQVHMTQCSPTYDEPDLPATELTALLGVAEDAIEPSIRPGIASTGLRHLFVALRDPAALGRMQRDDEGLRTFSRAHGLDTIGVFALDGVPQPGHATARLRDLCHGVGNPEESASGTTNGALASFLAARGVLRPERGAARLRVVQGAEMGRPSQIETLLDFRDGVVDSVRVGGSAVRVMEGHLLV